MAALTEASCKTEAGFDIPHIAVPEIWALDYDETLGDTEAAMARLYAVASEFGVSPAHLTQERQRVEEAGRSFNAFTFMQRRLEREDFNHDRFNAFGQAFLDAQGPNLLFDDAPVLLNRLHQTPSVPHTILTYGEGTSRADLLYQAVKVAASGYHGRVELTTNRDKGPQIEHWRGPDGTYDFLATDIGGRAIALFHANTAILVDDKAASLENLQYGSRGALLIRPNRPRTAKQGYEIPETIADRAHIVSGLGDLMISGSYQIAGCSPEPEETISRITDIAAFHPVSFTSQNPNIYVRPGMSFQALRTAVEATPATFI